MASNRNEGSNEDRLIARLFKPLATDPGALGLTDDAALLTPPPGHDLVLTTDAVIAGVHFFPDEAPGDVARKALRVNLSDLTAKGARPLGFLLSLALPKDTSETWLDGFAHGLGADIKDYSCALFGGDTDRTPGPLSVSIMMIGTVPHGTMVKRAGANAGDKILVTGTIGDAALGLGLRRDRGKWKLKSPERDHLVARYRLPQPRVALADALRAHAAAAMDISDGLAGDLAKLCRVSGVSAQIEVQKVPLSDAVRAVLDADPAALEIVLTGGDDYEILCVVSPDKAAALKAAASAVKVAITEIGTVGTGEGARLLGANGKALDYARPSFSHF